MSGDKEHASELNEAVTEPLSDAARVAYSQNLYVGLTLKERYVIEKEIGRGGIGVVLLARDQQLHSKRVVIKVLIDEYADPDMSHWIQRKFQQEIEALTLIDHPGVVGALDSGQMPNGKPYLVMQYVEGETLRCVLHNGPMELARAARVIKQIGQALSAAHDKGVCHRDLKPANIMLQRVGDDEEYVKLIDFGIATVKDSRVASGIETTRVAGTIAYMAPEQLKGKPSEASDIYALGVIAYQMLTGEIPFEADSAVELYDLQRRGVMVKPKELRSDLPEVAQGIIINALCFEPEKRRLKAREFGDRLARALSNAHPATGDLQPLSFEDRETSSYRSPVSTDSTLQATPNRQDVKVVLLYKRNSMPDEQVLRLLEEGLAAKGYDVFIDRHLSIGVEWAKEISRQVRTADAVVPLISAASITSEMMAYEIQIAHEAAQEQNGRPRLLPIRLGFEESLPETISGYLEPLQYGVWNGPADDEALLNHLLDSLEGQTFVVGASPRQGRQGALSLEAVGGAVPLESQFYIARQTDDEFYDAIARQDSIVLVKGARQMGKTSLLARGLQQAREYGAKVVLTDFQKLNSVHLESIESLFMTLGEMIADQLDLEVFPDDVWNSRRGPSVNFERYIRREVLGRLAGPMVWGLDEVDRLFTCEFGSEVFGLFRSWHNERSLDPTGPWRRLTLAIAYATEAHLFITDLNQSPFNVGTRLALEDFTREQVTELNNRYGSPLGSEAEVGRFIELVSGQPYLVRRGLHELATHSGDLASFEAVADRDEGPFGDHLRRILVLLAHDATLCEVIRAILQGKPCPNAETFYRLRSAGVITGESAREARPRCRLYTDYLQRHLL